METKVEKSVNGQLISVGHRDTIRLLEVYVKRSLSLNDSEYDDKKPQRKEKWVTNPRRKRLHSSDPSIHAPNLPIDIDINVFSLCGSSLDRAEKTDEESQKPNKTSKKKKGSFWKNLLNFFSLKDNEEKSEEEDGTPEVANMPQPGSADSVTPYLPNTPNTSQKRKILRKKTLRRRFSKQRLSLTKPNRSGKEHAEITRVDCKLCDIRRFLVIYSKGATATQTLFLFFFPAVISVEPTYSYYEKVTEELEKIVIEVQEKEEAEHLSDGEKSLIIIIIIMLLLLFLLLLSFT